MPEEEVSDFRDVFDAINKLCDTMKTSSYDVEDELNIEGAVTAGYEYGTDVLEYGLREFVNEPSITVSGCDTSLVTSENYSSMGASEYSNQVSECDSSTLVASENDSTMIASAIDASMLASDIFSSMLASQNDFNNPVQGSPIYEVQTQYRDIESTEETVHRQEANTERWSDAMSHISLQDTTATSDNTGQYEAGSEVYYTASSEVSLLSDSELPEKGQEDAKDGNYVIAGHVAAMRERFESMTRTNTPCPDLIRSLSPSLEVFRNKSPSPDRLA